MLPLHSDRTVYGLPLNQGQQAESPVSCTGTPEGKKTAEHKV